MRKLSRMYGAPEGENGKLTPSVEATCSHKSSAETKTEVDT